MACPTVSLSRVDIENQLNDLPDWIFNQNALERVYEGKNYLDALQKLNAIAQLSEAADHHPDLSLNWKKLTIRYWTHTAQGVSDLDFKLAHQAEHALRT
ncbi:4a-hydroxytetrahydrobiopterin dehydratase [Vampirovibrio sp.]|uniref:4a-hydroxytetrahydrobiopterin dehydratase n=1 Tax=Vampirovibrio sp. TaxID=2717857 RepID=UPI00359317EE